MGPRSRDSRRLPLTGDGDYEAEDLGCLCQVLVSVVRVGGQPEPGEAVRSGRRPEAANPEAVSCGGRLLDLWGIMSMPWMCWALLALVLTASLLLRERPHEPAHDAVPSIRTLLKKPK